MPIKCLVLKALAKLTFFITREKWIMSTILVFLLIMYRIYYPKHVLRICTWGGIIVACILGNFLARIDVINDLNYIVGFLVSLHIICDMIYYKWPTKEKWCDENRDNQIWSNKGWKRIRRALKVMEFFLKSAYPNTQTESRQREATRKYTSIMVI